jgi:Spy/CpxP family protein refolding chaperone
MKKLLILLTLLLSSGIFAQRVGNEKIKALKTAHITDALDLTPEEAQKFWPVYNDYEDEMEQIRKKERQEIGEVVRAGSNSLTDKEANAVIDKMLDLKTSELGHQKDLIIKLRAIIPPQKILKLRKAEDDFRRMLVERLKHRRGNR